MDKRVPSNLVLEIISGDNGIFLDYIRDESKAKVRARRNEPLGSVLCKPTETGGAL